ncbi:MAG TPA: TonB-dependent receptor [Pseudomonadales bacterium]|jgi:iron complex outermembrane receptor protein|nr:TonB-dependent receptor [Pseudomonadales bacterium]MDP6314654.1 TonB-dependent receptor [Pseudomonadales bacterium]MDP7313365.1 TonB-dependent receptor [Pseudomonadales bacterium]HJP51769.1 TonB-dependent receptor [Pseudomonadales bacterium]|tara:strand:- start:3452 stop:6028 length:2577 start_codon:yes stop_codon:yes gene_type:complete
MKSKSLALVAAGILVSPLALTMSDAYAAEASDIEEVVVTGTRKQGSSPTETLSPVDVIGGSTLSNQAAFDLTDGLPKIAPAINTQRFPIADGTAFIRPVTLRNLSPDQTLVLVNGTRRHRSPLVNLQLAPLGTVNQGAQAVDYAAIPAAAIERVEILRDGASAQYGSDAIAGVINLILKDDAEGITVSVQTGEYFEGDGERTTYSVNGGLALGDAGFLNLTFESSSSEITTRGVARPDAAFVETIVPGEVPLGGTGQRWGDPDVETTKWFANTAFSLTDAVEIYANLSYTENETVSDFFYRGPVLDPSHETGARETLQTDADGDFVPDDAPQSLIDSINGAGLNPSDYLVANAASASGFVLRNPIYVNFPGGYNPNFGADITDQAYVVGARGETDNGLMWDITLRSADAEAAYHISETINPSLGALSPMRFKPGTLTQEEESLTIDLVKSLDVGNLASPLNLAFGFEWRDETYVIGAGDQASIEAGPTAAYFGVGSDGFQGFPVESAGSFESESIAYYIDLEADITETFSAGIAFRYEDFDEFDSTSDWKISGRWDVSENFALRATANTGFRIPTPGQVHTLNITTTSDINGNLIPNGTYPVDNPVALSLGSKPLDPEESTSFTLGAIWVPVDNVSVTVDYYNIEIEDRLALLTNTVSATEVATLTAAGIANADLLLGSVANFFVNGFESQIDGVDIAIRHELDMNSGSLTTDLRHSFNQQEVNNVAANTINQSRVFDLENQVPENRTALTFTYQTDSMFSGLVRINHYDDWRTTGGLFSPPDASDASSYDGETLVDIEATFTINENYQVTVGGDNVFDVEPGDEQNGVLQFLGVTKSITSPFGFNGGFWYVRLSADF